MASRGGNPHLFGERVARISKVARISLTLRRSALTLAADQTREDFALPALLLFVGAHAFLLAAILLVLWA